MNRIPRWLIWVADFRKWRKGRRINRTLYEAAKWADAIKAIR